MGNMMSFVASFDLRDNFSQKFDAIQKRVTSVSKSQHNIDFSIKDSGIVKQTQDLGKKLQESTAGISKAVSIPAIATGAADKSVSDLKGMYSSLADQTYTTVFDVDDAGAIQKTQELGEKLQDSTAGISDAVENAKLVTVGYSTVQRAAGDAVNQHTSATQKASNALETLKSKYAGVSQGARSALSGIQDKFEGITGSVQKLAGSLAAMAAGGALAGLSYVGAEQTQNRIQDTVKAVSGNKKNQMPEAKLNDYIKSMSGSGWTSSGKMSDTVQTAYLLGGKYAKGQKGLDLADAAEKISFAKQDSLGGDSGSDLIGSAAKQGKLRATGGANSELARFRVATADVSGIAGYESMIQTASGRLKLLKKEAKTINIKAEMDRHPWAVAQQNISDFKNAIGLGIAGPMGKISMLVAGLAKAMKDVPGLAGIVGWAAILMSLAGAVSMAISVFSPLIGAMKGLGIITKLQTVYTWALSAANTVTAAVTRLLTVNTISDVAIQNASTFARLRMIGASIWQTAVIKGQAAATMISNMVSWASVGAMTVLAGVYGLLTGSISLSTLATWAFNGAMAVLDALDPFTYIVAGAAILAGIIGYLVVKSGVLAPIWKDLQKIWKDITKGKFEKIMPDIGKMIGKIDIGGIFKTIVGKGPEEAMGFISTGITGLLAWVSNYIAPFISKIHDILKKVQSIFEWIYSLWQGALSWLKAGLGITKKEKEAKVAEAATKAGVEWRETGDSGPGFYKKENMGWFRQDTGVDDPKFKSLYNLKDKADKAPKGIFDLLGIADAVAKGMSGIGTIIADAIKGVVMGIPGMPELAKAIDNLRTWLSSSGLGGGSLGGNTEYGPSSGAKPAETGPTGRTAYTNPSGGYELHYENGDIYSYASKEKSKDDFLVGHAVGATFTRSGLFQGRVHSPEEIIPQAVASRGPGPIAKALDLLNGVTAGRNMPSATTAGAGGDIHIHNNNDFSGMKVSSNVDIEALMRRIDKRIEAVSLQSTKRAIGQGRT